MVKRTSIVTNIVDEIAFYMQYHEKVENQSDVDFYLTRNGKRYRVFVQEIKPPHKMTKREANDPNWVYMDAGRNQLPTHNQ